MPIKKYNSDENSDFDENDDDMISQQAGSSYVKEELYDTITKYLKTDDLIRKQAQKIVKYRERINIMKQQKNELEQKLIKYLDIIDQDQITIGGDSKLSKCESSRKCPLNADIIKNCIIEKLRNDKIIKDDMRAFQLAESLYENMENNRERKTRTYIRRVIDKNKKKEFADDSSIDSDDEITTQSRISLRKSRR